MNIKLLKYMRLVLALMIYAIIIVYYFYSAYYNLPDQGLLITTVMSVFVFLLGLQYHIEKRPGMMSKFLMLFSFAMFLVTVVSMIIT